MQDSRFKIQMYLFWPNHSASTDIVHVQRPKWFKTWWQQATKYIFTDIRKLISIFFHLLRKICFTGLSYTKTAENSHFYIRTENSLLYFKWLRIYHMIPLPSSCPDPHMIHSIIISLSVINLMTSVCKLNVSTRST